MSTMSKLALGTARKAAMVRLAQKMGARRVLLLEACALAVEAFRRTPDRRGLARRRGASGPMTRFVLPVAGVAAAGAIGYALRARQSG